MSTEGSARASPRCRTLSEYVLELVEELGRADPRALERLRLVVGRRRARIRLDEEAVDVRFAGDRLVAEPPAGQVAVDGEGATDRATVLDLLDGYLEVADAILDGRLDVTGDIDAVTRMFSAIEILLDASVRAPALQQLARDFRADPCREPRGPPARATRRAPWYPAGYSDAELELLGHLDLLPAHAERGGPIHP